MVRIITDSAADFEPAHLQAMNIACIPLTVLFEDNEYQENITLTKERFYQLLEETESFPKTAQASPQILQDLFEEAHEAGDEAIYITISSAISGTYQTAVMVQNMLGYETCHVLDSRKATGGQRMLVEYAVRLRDLGKSAAEIAAAVESVRDRVTLYACIDTLEYLYRGGRISHTAYALGSLAQIKPIISIDEEGKVIVPGKAMGMRKGMDMLCKKLEQKKPDENFPWYVMYTKNRKNGEILAQRLSSMGYEVPDERIVNVGAAIGSHIGPDGCGLVYIAQE